MMIAHPTQEMVFVFSCDTPLAAERGNRKAPFYVANVNLGEVRRTKCQVRVPAEAEKCARDRMTALVCRNITPSLRRLPNPNFKLFT